MAYEPILPSATAAFDPNVLNPYSGFTTEWALRDPVKEKVDSLNAAKAEKEELFRKQKEERADKYFMSDANAQSGLGGVVNTVGGFFGTAARVGGNILGVPELAAESGKPVVDFMSQYIPQGVKDAYGAVDEALTIRSDNKTAKDLTKVFRDPTGLLSDFGKFVGDSWEGYYNPVNVEELQADFSKDFDTNEGVLRVAGALAKTAATNPVKGAELFVTNFPYMYAAAQKGIPGAAAFLGMVNEFNNESLEKYKETHNGQLPDAKAQAVMLGTGVAAAATEKVASMFQLGKIGGPNIAPKVLSVPTR
jgi:hypothetical protein